MKDVKGIGERVTRELVDHYGSEEEALSSFARFEFEKLLQAPIPGHKLVEITRELYAQKHGFEYSDLLKTPEAKELYSGLMSILKGYACTDYGRVMLNAFSPTMEKGEISRRLDYMEGARKMAKALDKERLEKIRRLLKRLRPLSPGKKWKKRAVIATEDRSLCEDMKTRFPGLVDALLIDSMEEAASLADYDFVRYLRTSSDRFWEGIAGLRHVEEVFEREEEKLLPEAVLSFYGSNQGEVLAALELAELVPEAAKRELPDGFSEMVEKVGEGQIDAGCDVRLKNTASASGRLREVTYECLKMADDAIRERVEKGGVAIAGGEVLEMLKNVDFSDPARVYDHLPPELVDILRGEAERCEVEIAKRLGIDDEMLFVGLFSEHLHYPLEITEGKLEEIQGELRVKKERAEYGAMKKLASTLGEHIGGVEELVRELLELDVELALGTFASDFELVAPELSEPLGVTLVGARHLELQKEALKGALELQPVTYALGDAGERIKGSEGERITILTGANSGGKTTLLETIAQAQIMAQCGLGVCAEKAELSLLDGVYLFARRKGAGDAGAFESLLRDFEGLSERENDGKRLVLADEIEAVTEPGAAAEIISAFLEWFLRDENVLMAVVSHLGEEVAKGAPKGVRIDGIDATGLDSELHLIVDRTPVLNKLARSTPELIVERLSRSRGGGGEFYKHILDRFKRSAAK